jgi:branched-chain amino acid transport system substrate-binding protein
MCIRPTRLVGASFRAVAFLLGAAVATAAASVVKAADPIKIGFSIPITGGLASNGKAVLTAYQMWEEDINASGGLLGRAVKLVYYDDQSNPTLVPGIYTKLLNVDKIDLVLSSYGTNMSMPAMPVVMAKKLVLMSLFALAVNEQFRYPNYFPCSRRGRTRFMKSRAASSRSRRTSNPACRPSQ